MPILADARKATAARNTVPVGRKAKGAKTTTRPGVGPYHAKAGVKVVMDEAMLIHILAGVESDVSSWRVIKDGKLSQGKLAPKKRVDRKTKAVTYFVDSVEGGGKARQEYARLVLEDGLTKENAAKQVLAIFLEKHSIFLRLKDELKTLDFETGKASK